ncbi:MULTISPECIES: ParB N-terminal domain-containing protein [Yersiniaceae]|uniref:Transcriptional regulator n=1 Tax=Nissabacter archeti TaxID=1917880 RepID=A0ABS5JHC9_9GAMM|nr:MULTISPECIES: hypothetical protein [Yersiniaceae]MBS0969381.1 transcriptional regulator [Nissabacter archeti]MDV5140169.1 transcriptional regulator [Chimaeribacter arupi]
MPEHVATETSVNYIVQLEKITCLRQSEEISSEAVKGLSARILCEGIWTTVIPVEWASGWVMDGNHRLNVARHLGLTHLPVVRLRYDDPRVSVLRWDNETPYPTTQISAEIARRVLLPFKTTKHRFSPLLPEVRISLNELRIG